MKTKTIIAKWLALGLVLMGLIHIGATFSPMIADKLAPLNEGGQKAFTYMSLMCGALLVMGGAVAHLLVGKRAKYTFLNRPYMLVVTVMAIDGILAPIYMPHNPCAWTVLALALPLMGLAFCKEKNN